MSYSDKVLLYPQPANEVSPQISNEKGLFLPIHLLGSHHCVSTLYYLTLLRLSKCVLFPRSPQDFAAKTFQEY